MRARRLLLLLGGAWLSALLAVGSLWGTGHDATAGGSLFGDANEDGHVDAIDAALVLQYSAGLLSSINPNADANGNGETNAIDAAVILQYVAGLVNHIGPPATATPTRTPTLPTSATGTPVPATATFTPVPATATPTSSGGCQLTFASYYTDTDQFCGVVTDIQRRDSIPAGLLFNQVDAPPGSEFAVVFMSVTNFALGPGAVSTESFRVRDQASRIFTLDYPDVVTANINAEDYFSLHGPYQTIQPGLTDGMVFVFLVPSEASGLFAERCSTDGCDVGAPAPPGPPGGCSLTFASYYTDTDQFCGVVTDIQRRDSIPAGLLFNQVDAPPGSEFAVVFMSVTNFALGPGAVGTESFRVRDQASRIFTLDYPDVVTANINAEDYFSLHGPYQTIQPGLTDGMVFVFLVPSGAAGLTAERCPTTGCS